nr:methyltransferase domain-containing protein [Actinomadura flavalba]
MGSYAQGHHDTVLSAHRWRTVENSAGYLVPFLRDGISVLDVGCGPGTITVEIGARVGDGRVVGVDSAAGVVGEAVRLAAERGAGNVAFEVADVGALPFPDGAFDVVHAHQVLQHVSDPVAALREMRRVARRGGIVAVRDADYGGMIWHPRPPEMEPWRDLYTAVAREAGGEPDAGRRLVSWARQAGFTDVTPSASIWCFATPQDRAWWSASWGGRMVRSDIADRVVAAGHATRADLDRVHAGWTAWAAADDGWFAVPHGEILCRT